LEWLLGALGGLIGGNAAGAKNSLGVGGGGVVGAVLTAIVGAVMKSRQTK
jgi:hypothetical protein